MHRGWQVALGIAQVLGGIGLVGWAILFYGLSGWGIDFGDMGWQVFAVLPWFSPLAVGLILRARRSQEGRRALAGATVACLIATLVTIVSGLFFAPAYTTGPQPFPAPLQLPFIPLGIGFLFLGFVTLAIPALAARSVAGRVAAWVPFALGATVCAYPAGWVPQDDLREWLLATVTMLVTLGIILVAVGVGTLRARDGAYEG